MHTGRVFDLRVQYKTQYKKKKNNIGREDSHFSLLKLGKERYDSLQHTGAVLCIQAVKNNVKTEYGKEKIMFN